MLRVNVQVSTKTTVVNFSVKQLGLEAQLLGIVVQREQPSLEEQSSELTVKVSYAHTKTHVRRRAYFVFTHVVSVDSVYTILARVP